MNAILLASAGMVVLLIGGGIGFWAGRSGVGGSKARVEKAEAELEDYKRNVTEHFGRTAEHFQAIGKQYRELYEHMASGAQVLCEPDEAGKNLLFAPEADAVSADAEERQPADYAQQVAADDATDTTVATDTPDAPDAAVVADEPVEEQQVELSDDAGSIEAKLADGPVSEAANDPQPETEAEANERTLH